MVENEFLYNEEEYDGFSFYDAETAFSDNHYDEEDNMEDDEAWWYSSKYMPLSIEEEDAAIASCREETAWCGCLNGDGDERWYYLEVNELLDEITGRPAPVVSTETIWAGEFTDIGTVTYDPELNIIIIDLTDGWKLQDVEEPVKIQGYDVLPSDTPSAELFTTYKGKRTTIEVGPYKYYAIHLDVQIGT
ncbi:MAG: hypothetical protein JW965_00250 [Bacteroidales bacterium]|nr:hypothetical protein [Bacteroidales bacterium]